MASGQVVVITGTNAPGFGKLRSDMLESITSHGQGRSLSNTLRTGCQAITLLKKLSKLAYA